MRSLGLVWWLVVGGCALAVQARGPVTQGPDGQPVITGLNGKQRPLVARRFPELTALEGHLVELEGVLRRGMIHVDTCDVEEGPLGLPVYRGRARVDPRGDVWLDDGKTGASFRITGDQADIVADHVGSLVLVEGIVAGRMGVQAMGVVVVPEPR